MLFIFCIQDNNHLPVVCRALAEYLVEGFAKCADARVLRSCKELLTKTASVEFQTSEYAVQSEFGVVATLLIQMLPRTLVASYSMYRLVRLAVERSKTKAMVGEESVPPPSMAAVGRRAAQCLSILVTNQGAPCVGCKLAVQATQAEFDERVARGRIYALEHDCLVVVVNVAFTDSSGGKRVQLPSSDSMVWEWPKACLPPVNT